jgi:hypothetical protein
MTRCKQRGSAWSSWDAFYQMPRFRTEFFTQAYARRKRGRRGNARLQSPDAPRASATPWTKASAIPGLGAPGHSRHSRARALLPIYRAAQAACGSRVLGSCPRCPGGMKRRGNLGRRGFVVGRLCVQGTSVDRATRLQPVPTSRRSESKAGGERNRIASGDAKRAVCQRLLREHACAAATRHDEPSRRGDRSPQRL